MTGERWFSDLVTHDHRPLEEGPAPDDRPPATDAGETDRQRPHDARKPVLPVHGTSVLTSLAAFRYLTSRQIERLHFRQPHRTPGAAVRAAHRTVSSLHQLRMVDRLDRRIGGRHAGSAGFVWRLTPKGARAAAPATTSRRAREPGIAHLAHTLDVAEVAVRLQEHTRTHPTTIVAVETEPGCWRRYTTAAGKQAWLKPDLRLTLRVPGSELHWFVELDRGSEHRHVVQRKVGLYLAAWRDGAEQARSGVFPRVAWIVPDEARATVVASVCRSAAGAPPALFVVTVRTHAIATLTEPPA